MNFYNTIRKCSLFNELNLDECDSLLNDAGVLEYSSGDLILDQGDPISNLAIVLDGELEIFREHESGTRLNLQNLQRYDYFGEFLFSNEMRSPYGVKCLKDCSIVTLDFENFISVFKRDPILYGILLHNLLRKEQEKLWVAAGLIARINAEGVLMGLPLYGQSRLKPHEVKQIKKRKKIAC